ncbi:MAG TPA: DedA family protein [Blastocatellia bacterium]|nr:DedA family protein [Blastocatellia bacterium]
MDQFITWLQQLPPYGVLALIFFIAYIENIFPPSPSDMLIVFAGTLIGVGSINFIQCLVAATLGSTFGFMTAYLLGRYFEPHLMAGRFGRWLPTSALLQVEKLFRRYGYGVIVANRFLSGTRAIISFFAGMSRMSLPATTLLSAVSAALWNSLLLFLGIVFARNWRTAAEYIQIYSTVVSIVIGVALIILLLVYLRRRRNATNSVTTNE